MTPLMPPKSFRAFPILLAAVSLAVLLGSQPRVLAQSTADPEADAKALGGEMKAAVAVGMLDGEQARKLYFEILGLMYGDEKGEEVGEKGRKDWSRDDPRRGGMTYERFLISDGGDFTTLLSPEFLARDGALLTEGLDRDPALVALIDSLLEDYEAGFEAEATAFRDALSRARNQHELDGIQQTLGVIRMTPFTRAEIERNVAETLQKTNRGGMDTGQVSEWAEGRIVSLQERVGTLQNLIADKLSHLESTGTNRSPREILAMIESLRSERVALRTALEENLRAVVSEDAAAATEVNLDLVRLEHGRRNARFGGADIDLGRALREASEPEGPDDATYRMLLELNASIADLVDARTAARIDREVKTARALVEMLAGEGPGGVSGDRLVMAAAERELVAGRVVRDATIQAMMRIHEALTAGDPVLADRFLQLARR
ncbi:MAG: hypothetical protein VX672_08035, partial [Planctomycetota bacterium]|nr:hypothetical protein [Planctomycetota bacterium]